LVRTIEKVTSDNRIVNGPLLEGRTIQKPIVPDITSVPDALAVSLDATGKLDLDHIAKLVDRPKDEIVDQLGDLIYEVPGATWMLADEYLSGDVKKKLDEAKAAAEIDHKYQRNVEALLKVQPAPLAPHDITVNPGANWIPLDIYNDFIHEVLGQPDNFGVYYNGLFAK
jgi:N12 class adenine-specific DNA methylase